MYTVGDIGLQGIRGSVSRSTLNIMETTKQMSTRVYSSFTQSKSFISYLEFSEISHLLHRQLN